jgi:hypothetical protein
LGVADGEAWRSDTSGVAPVGVILDAENFPPHVRAASIDADVEPHFASMASVSRDVKA